MSMPPPPPPPGSIPPPPPGFGGVPGYGGAPGSGTMAPSNAASFGVRLGAHLIDGLVGLAFTLPGVVLGFASDALGLLVQLAGAVAFIFVYSKLLGTTGQSWGKKALKIKVLDAQTGSFIGQGRAVGRYFAMILSGFACGLGYFWMLWDPKKQTWHDKIVGTSVVTA